MLGLGLGKLTSDPAWVPGLFDQDQIRSASFEEVAELLLRPSHLMKELLLLF